VPAVAAAPASAVVAKPAAAATPTVKPELGSPTMGSVEVRALEGARVEIDGEDRGTAPVSLDLPPGEHTVKVTAPGYYPWKTTLDVTPGVNAAVRAELVEAEAAVAEVAEVAEEPKPSSKSGKKRGKSGSRKSSKGKSDSTSTADPFMNGSKPKPKPKNDDIFMPVPGGK
jgi:hypothetical protein